MVNFLYSIHFTVQSQKFGIFPVLTWQTLPFQCYIWEINPNIWDFPDESSGPCMYPVREIDHS